MLFVCILLLATSCLVESLQNDTIQQDSSELVDENLFQGDLKLTKEEIQEALGGGSRAAVVKDKRWPSKTIPYTINTRRPLRKILIHSAIREWEEFTCLKFVEYDVNSYKRPLSHIEFKVDKGGCWSDSVGYRRGKQIISLGLGCITHGIAVHEIGHALGLWHEQSRPDRDNYVEILWDNIPDDRRYQFQKMWNIDTSTPYDYKSIMHYGKRDFAWPPWKTTIKTKNGEKIGYRRHLSELDKKRMNKYYDCKN